MKIPSMTQSLLFLAVVLLIGLMFFNMNQEKHQTAGAAKFVAVTLWGTTACPVDSATVSTGIAYFPNVGGSPICVSNTPPNVTYDGGMRWATGSGNDSPINFDAYNGTVSCVTCIVKPSIP